MYTYKDSYPRCTSRQTSQRLRQGRCRFLEPYRGIWSLRRCLQQCQACGCRDIAQTSRTKICHKARSLPPYIPSRRTSHCRRQSTQSGPTSASHADSCRCHRMLGDSCRSLRPSDPPPRPCPYRLAAVLCPRILAQRRYAEPSSRE